MKQVCPDCGPATVPHAFERWSTAIDAAVTGIHQPFEWVYGLFAPAIAALRPGYLAGPIAALCATLHLGVIVTAPDDKVNLRTQVLWEEAARRGIVMKEFRPFDLARELFWASYRSDVRAFDGLPRPRGASSAALNWMDDKGIIIKKFRAAGIPVPRGRSCRTLAQAEQTFRGIGGPVIVKPNLGSRSRHTYVGIADPEALRHAFGKAKEISFSPVVEEELSGFVFRITLIGGKVAGVMRREPPHVTGDGRHTVRQLVEEENKNPLRRGPIFHGISMDEAPATLAAQGLTPDSVPAAGRMVVIHPKVSRSFGASTTEITDIHPDNGQLFAKIAETLNDPIVGVDFMIG
ncbi:MAG TPA: hypothetical protein VMT81_03145, partial [Candidatus Paceibacterota bacterium]|nr:hypothetical protein [Candidatus Paceibacterota bacterium]